MRFNIATHRETKEERATYVEILPDSFEESTEQRRHVRLKNKLMFFDGTFLKRLTCIFSFGVDPGHRD